MVISANWRDTRRVLFKIAFKADIRLVWYLHETLLNNIIIIRKVWVLDEKTLSAMSTSAQATRCGVRGIYFIKFSTQKAVWLAAQQYF